MILKKYYFFLFFIFIIYFFTSITHAESSNDLKTTQTTINEFNDNYNINNNSLTIAERDNLFFIIDSNTSKNTTANFKLLIQHVAWVINNDNTSKIVTISPRFRGFGHTMVLVRGFGGFPVVFWSAQ